MVAVNAKDVRFCNPPNPEVRVPSDVDRQLETRGIDPHSRSNLLSVPVEEQISGWGEMLASEIGEPVPINGRTSAPGATSVRHRGKTVPGNSVLASLYYHLRAKKTRFGAAADAVEAVKDIR